MLMKPNIEQSFFYCIKSSIDNVIYNAKRMKGNLIVLEVKCQIVSLTVDHQTKVLAKYIHLPIIANALKHAR